MKGWSAVLAARGGARLAGAGGWRGQKRFLQVIAGIVAGAAVLAGLVLFGGGPPVLRAAAAVPARSLLAAAGLTLLGLALRAFKWHLYSRALGAHIKLGQSMAVYASGQSMLLTPFRAGEVLKCLLLERIAGTPMARSLPALVSERVTDGIAVSVLAALPLALAAAGVPGGASLYPAAARPVVLALLVVNLGAAVLLAIPAIQAFATRLAARPRGAASRWRQFAQGLTTGTGASFQPRLLLPATALTIGAWALQCLAFHVLAVELGAGVTPLGAMGLYSVATLFGTVSFIPAGLGAVEGSLTFLLVRLGLPTHQAAAATLLGRLFAVWLVMTLGALALAASLSAWGPRKAGDGGPPPGGPC